MLTLGQAAKLAGVGKTTLTRAIRAGRLSATPRDGGGYMIDPAELERVYTLRSPGTATGGATVAPVHHATPGPNAETLARLAAAEAQVRGLRELLSEVTRTRDAYERQVTALTAALPK